MTETELELRRKKFTRMIIRSCKSVFMKPTHFTFPAQDADQVTQIQIKEGNYAYQMVQRCKKSKERTPSPSATISFVMRWGFGTGVSFRLARYKSQGASRWHQSLREWKDVTSWSPCSPRKW